MGNGGGIIFGVSSDVIFYVIGGSLAATAIMAIAGSGSKPQERQNYEVYATSYAVGRLEDRMLNIIHAVATNRQQVRDMISRIRAELAKYRQQLVDAIMAFRDARTKFQAGQITKQQLLDALATLRAAVRAIIKNIVETLQIGVRINLNPIPLPSQNDMRDIKQKAMDDAIAARHMPGTLPGGTLPPGNWSPNPWPINPAIPG